MDALGSGPINLSGGTLQSGNSGGMLTNAVNITGNVTLAGLTFSSSSVTITGAPTITVASPVTIADAVSGNLVIAGSERPDPHRGHQ